MIVGKSKFELEVHLKRLRILVAPQMNFYPNFPGKQPFTIYISKMATVGNLHKKIASSLQKHGLKDNQDHPVKNLIDWSRLWKIDWKRESPIDLPNLVQRCINNQSFDMLPLEIYGEVLSKDTILESLDLEDD